MGMLEETWLYLKKNRFLLGAVLFEFLFLLILTVRLLQPSVRIEINGSELIKTGSWNTAVSGSYSRRRGGRLKRESVGDKPCTSGSWRIPCGSDL